MLDAAEPTLVTIAESWLSEFGRAIETSDEDALRGLFLDDSHWRDVLALSWHIETIAGRDDIAAGLSSGAETAGMSTLQIERTPVPPRTATRVGTEVIEAFFTFTTSGGPGSGHRETVSR